LDYNSDGHKINILDLGANIGYFTLKFVDTLLRYKPSNKYYITCVEGNPKIYDELKVRLKHYNNLGENCNIVNGLIGMRSGKGRILNLDFHVMNSVVNTNVKGFDVNYIDLNTVISKNRKLDLVKCDIEGSELIFLKSYRDLLADVKYIVIEFHHDRCDKNQCLKILGEYGFIHNELIRLDNNISTNLYWRD